jgi:hypothetical protein
VGEASEISRAVAAVAALYVRRRRAMYGQAVAFGVANTHCSSERERQFGALRLLTLATLRLPDVALYGELLHSYAGDPRACGLVAQTLIGAFVVATATIDDGGVATYRLRFTLEGGVRGWAVSSIEAG